MRRPAPERSERFRTYTNHSGIVDHVQSLANELPACADRCQSLWIAMNIDPFHIDIA
jgi:hypothetical protein